MSRLQGRLIAKLKFFLMSQFLCEENFPNWQNFSDWMAKQICLNPNMLDKYTLLLSGPIHEALTNGKLKNKPFDPYKHIHEAITVLKDSKRVTLVLSFVSFLLSQAKKYSTTDEYYEELIKWHRAWIIFSVYVKTVILPECLDVSNEEELTSGYMCHDILEPWKSLLQPLEKDRNISKKIRKMSPPNTIKRHGQPQQEMFMDMEAAWMRFQTI